MAKVRRNPLIEQVVKSSRSDWNGYTLAQEKEIAKLFSEAAGQISNEILKSAKGGKIPSIRLRYLHRRITKITDSLRKKVRGRIRRMTKNSIDYGMERAMLEASVLIPKGKFKIGVGTAWIDEAGKIHKFRADKEKYSDSVWSRLNLEAFDAVTKTDFGGIPFSRRIWDSVWPAEKSIKYQVQLAIIRGSDAAKLARDIKKYLGVPDIPVGKVLKDFHPGAGVYKSAYKNTMRVARTEINRAYTEGTYRYSKHKSWVDGYIWRTASGNPCEVCDPQDGVFYPKEDPPAIPAHPHCFCYPEIHYKGS